MEKQGSRARALGAARRRRDDRRGAPARGARRPRRDTRCRSTGSAPNPNQPRRDFDEKELAGPRRLDPREGRDPAADPAAAPGRGRRATRSSPASAAGGRRSSPACTSCRRSCATLSDAEVLELAIIENIQRADLNPLEEAQGYRQLMDRFGHTQERLAEALGKSRSHIANLLRLLTLPEPVLELLRAGKLTAGHARALVTATNPESLARQVVDRDLSVRQTEPLARAAAAGRRAARRAAPGGEGRRHPRARGGPDREPAAQGLDRAPPGPAGGRAPHPLRDARGARRPLPAARRARSSSRRSTASSSGRPGRRGPQPAAAARRPARGRRAPRSAPPAAAAPASAA